jgi:hypothetical protein
MHPNTDTSEAAVISIYNDDGKSFQELIEEYLKIVLTQTDEK